MTRFVKAVVAVVGALFVLFQSGITADGINRQEWLQITIAGVGAFSVWLTANYVEGSVFDKYAKFITSALYAGLVAMGGYLTDEVLTSSERWNVVIAVLAALGVGYFGNAPETKVASVTPPPH